MRIHHLNCGTLTPAMGRLMRDPAARPGPMHLVCHVLLIETGQGLVLVDAGMGLADLAAADARLGRMFRQLVGPALSEAETAYRQIQALGLDPADVRHIVLTHLDVDHAGGIADFPQAKVHVLATEHDAATAGGNLMERYRYRPVQWAHGPDWSLHKPDGEPWQGFPAVRGLDGLPPEILMIPLAGHTRGHAGIAVDAGDGWLLHAGDAYFYHDQMATPPRCPVGLRAFQRMMAIQDRARRDNIERLHALANDVHAGVDVFCAHDAHDLHRFTD